MCIFVIYIQFFYYCLFVSNSQVIGCEDHPRNDLYCVGWGVKLYSINQSAWFAVSFISLNGSYLLQLYSVRSDTLHYLTQKSLTFDPYPMTQFQLYFEY